MRRSKRRFLYERPSVPESGSAYQDAGDDEYQWVAVDDEEKGRVFISTINSGMRIRPIHVVQSAWIRLLETSRVK